MSVHMIDLNEDTSMYIYVFAFHYELDIVK